MNIRVKRLVVIKGKGPGTAFWTWDEIEFVKFLIDKSHLGEYIFGSVSDCFAIKG